MSSVKLPMLFQFHKVQLKDSEKENFIIGRKLFQFHKVQLKESVQTPF